MWLKIIRENDHIMPRILWTNFVLIGVLGIPLYQIILL